LNPYTERLLLKHRGGRVLLDSNLMLLWFIGLFQRALIGKFKRVSMFSLEDFDLLARILRNFRAVATTPNILTEVSNLSGSLTDQLRSNYFASFANSIELLQEDYVPSSQAVANPLFRRLGLTDAAIANVAMRSLLVVTTDFELYYRLQALGADAVNFNHERLPVPHDPDTRGN
jgi:hypothetical protein